jgi:hypothetical protein
MRDTRVDLKNPLIAGVLAFLIPGAGHWYQGRRFKATIYSICILTLFVWGMILGNWQPVYSQLVYRMRAETAQLEKATPPTRFSFGYAAQFFAGASAFPALIQESRFRNEKADLDILNAPIESDFFGILRLQTENGESARAVSGQIRITPVNPEGSREIKGTLTVIEEGKTAEFGIGGAIEIGREVFGSPRRDIRCSVVNNDGLELPTNGTLQGTVSRSFLNWFQAPRDSQELDRLHGDLSRKFDIASVFTWIAGLLNLLAIWDAADGPAYGYGDEKPRRDDDGEDDDDSKEG